MKRVRVLLSFVFLFILSSCSFLNNSHNNNENQSKDKDFPSTKIEKTVTVLDGKKTKNSNGSIAIEKPILNEHNLSVDSVIAIDQSDEFPSGALKRIIEQSVSGDMIVYEVEDVALDEVINEGVLSAKINLTTDDILNANSQMNASVLPSSKTTLKVDLSTISIDGIKLSGYIEISPSLEFDMEFKENSLKSLKFKNTFVQSSEIKITVNETLSIKKMTPLGNKIKFKPVTVFIGYVPVVIQPVLQFHLNIDANINSQFNISASYSSNGLFQMDYLNDEFSVEKDFDHDPKLNSFSILNVDTKAGIYIEPSLSLNLYGLDAINMKSSTGLEYNGFANKNPFLIIDSKFNLKGVIDFTVISKKLNNYSSELISLVKNLLTLTLEPPKSLSLSQENSNVIITWNSALHALSYDLYWSNSSNIDKSNSTLISSVQSGYTHSNLSNGTYYYRVASKINDIESSLSNVASIQIENDENTPQFKDFNIELAVQGAKELPESLQDMSDINMSVLNLHIKDTGGSLYLASNDHSETLSFDKTSYSFTKNRYNKNGYSTQYDVKGNVLIGVSYTIDDLLCCVLGLADPYPSEYGGAEAVVTIEIEGITPHVFTKWLPHPNTTWIIGELNPTTGELNILDTLDVPTVPIDRDPIDSPIF
jgi:hypothetical protein